MIHSTSVDVSRASHAQNVPQIGLAQSMPMTSVTVVKTRPVTAPARANRSATRLPLRRWITPPARTTAKHP